MFTSYRDREKHGLILLIPQEHVRTRAGVSAVTSGGGSVSAAVGRSSSHTAIRSGVGWATNILGSTISSTQQSPRARGT